MSAQEVSPGKGGTEFVVQTAFAVVEVHPEEEGEQTMFPFEGEKNGVGDESVVFDMQTYYERRRD